MRSIRLRTQTTARPTSRNIGVWPLSKSTCNRPRSPCVGPPRGHGALRYPPRLPQAADRPAAHSDSVLGSSMGSNQRGNPLSQPHFADCKCPTAFLCNRSTGAPPGRPPNPSPQGTSASGVDDPGPVPRSSEFATHAARNNKKCMMLICGESAHS